MLRRSIPQGMLRRSLPQNMLRRSLPQNMLRRSLPQNMLRRSACRLHSAAKPLDINEVGKFRYYKAAAVEGIRHLYHGSRLFYTNARLAWKLNRKVKRGVALTRRERILVERATVDMLRLVPFSVFIIVPGGELLLPVALKMFPGLIPSTFESEAQTKGAAFAKDLARKQARKKLEEYATMQIISVTAEHNDILRRMSASDRVRQKRIRQISPVFRTGAALGWDKLPNDVILALGRVTGDYKTIFSFVPQAYAAKTLRSSIKANFDKVKADDKAIHEEDIAMLTREELVQANQRRGMRWVDGDAALLSQLQDWVTLSTEGDIPFHMLYFIRPTHHSAQESFRGLDKETRQKLLDSMNLPVHVRENLEEICNKVSTHENESELDDDAEEEEEASVLAVQV